jgi:predicted glycosyltransferase
LGLGHVRRNLAIAAAVAEAEPDAAILIATSANEVEELGVPERADVLKLPGMRKVANGDYSSRRLPLASKDVRELRSSLLTAAVDSFRPTVMVVDKHPAGIGGELRDGLDALRADGGRAALGLRDILDEPARVFAEWAEHDLAAQIAEHYELILVYGVPAVFNTVREYRFPAELARMSRYCGYVVRSDEPAQAIDVPGVSRYPVVLGTAGGGEDGFEFLTAFVAAAAGMPWHSIVVSGRQAKRSEREALERLAGEGGVGFRTFVPTLSSLFPAVDALVCMGGYNTLVEAAAYGVPTVCVPRTTPRTEQLIRAQAFERLGLLRTIEPQHLDARTLRAAITSALPSSRATLAARAQTYLDLRGARTAAAHLLTLAAVSGTTDPALVAR